jgi:hypothetical protein
MVFFLENLTKQHFHAKSRTKIHARLPICMEDKINLGDIIRIKEWIKK